VGLDLPRIRTAVAIVVDAVLGPTVPGPPSEWVRDPDLVLVDLDAGDAAAFVEPDEDEPVVVIVEPALLSKGATNVFREIGAGTRLQFRAGP